MQCQNMVWDFSDNVIDCGDLFFLFSHIQYQIETELNGKLQTDVRMPKLIEQITLSLILLTKLLL